MEKEKKKEESWENRWENKEAQLDDLRNAWGLNNETQEGEISDQ